MSAHGICGVARAACGGAGVHRLLRLQSMASQCAPHQGSAVVLTASCYDLLPPPSWSHLVLQRLGTQLRQRQHNETCYHLSLVVDDEFCPGRCAALMPPDSSLAVSATCHDFASSLHSPIAVNAQQLPGTNWRRFRDRHGKEQSIIQHALLNRNVLHTVSSLEQRGFKRIWYVEMDVAFTGNWGDLLRRYDAPPMDSIDILSPDPLGECSTTDSFCSKTMWSGNLPDHTYHGSTYNKARARDSPSNTPGARADGRACPCSPPPARSDPALPRPLFWETGAAGAFKAREGPRGTCRAAVADAMHAPPAGMHDTDARRGELRRPVELLHHLRLRLARASPLEHAPARKCPSQRRRSIAAAAASWTRGRSRRSGAHPRARALRHKAAAPDEAREGACEQPHGLRGGPFDEMGQVVETRRVTIVGS